MADVFLSYSHRDRDVVREVQRLLEARGITTFLDCDDLRRGEPWPSAIEQALASSRSVVALLGRELGRWQKREIWVALDRQVVEEAARRSFPVIPVLLPGSDVGSGFLFANTWVDLRDGVADPDEIAALADAITGTEGGTPAQPRGDSGVCPYRGLDAFREEDAAFFRGREEVLETLSQCAGWRALVAVIGSSGSGKSSVVMAGLVPRLRRQRPPQRTWDVLSLLPGRDPFRRLARELVDWLNPDLSGDQLAERVEVLGRDFVDGRISPVTFVEEGLRASGADRLLLVVDQFEEVFTEAPAEHRVEFARTLLRLLQECRVTVVLTLRADFYGLAIDLVPELSKLMEAGVVHVGRLGREQLQRAIQEPARLVGLEFESDLLVEKILDDVGEEPGKLPLLEYALLELWRRRRDGKLLASAYEGIQGVGGAIATRADAVFEALDPTQQQAARWLMIRLVRLEPTSIGTERTRRRMALNDAASAVRSVVTAFSRPGVRLLVADRDEAGGDTVEVAHEALITAWTRLNTWVSEATELMLWRQRLEPSLAWWHEDKTNLLRGSALAEAERWLADRGTDVSPDERAFVNASVQAHAHEKAKETHGRQMRLRWASGIAIVAIVLLAAVGWGLLSARRESARARQALADTEFGRAVAVADEDAPVALAHLARAMRVEPSLVAPRSLAARVLFTVPAPYAILEHSDNVPMASFSPDGSRVATASWDKTARLWNATTGEPIGNPLVHGGGVYSVSFSPNGDRLLTASRDKTARMWDAQTGEPIGKPFAQPSSIGHAWFAADESRIITAAYDTTVQAWDAGTGGPVGKAIKPGARLWGATLSPDRRRVLTISMDGAARAWDAWTGAPVGKPLEYHGFGFVAPFSPDGRHVLLLTTRTAAQVWDVATGQAIGKPLLHQRDILAATFSPDGGRLVTASGDGTARVWDVRTGNAIAKPLDHQQPVYDAAFSPDGSRIVTASVDKTARVWDARTGEPMGQPLKHNGEVRRASFSPDGTRILTVCQDNTVWLWSAAAERPEIPTTLARGGTLLAFGLDTDQVVTAAHDGVVQTWNARTSMPTGTPLHGRGRALAAWVGVAGSRAITAPSPGTAQVWDLMTGQPIGKPIEQPGSILNAAFSPDGNRVITVASDGTCRVWDASTDDIVGEFRVESADAKWVFFSRDGHRIVTLSESVTRVWDARTARLVLGPFRHEKAFPGVAFSPDNRFLAVLTDAKTVRMFNAEAGTPVGPPLVHESEVQGIELSPDATRIVTGSAYGSGRIWDGRTGKTVADLGERQQSVLGSAFSDDGRLMVSASWRQGARVWDAWSGAPLAKPLQYGGPVDSALFDPGGTRVVTASRDKLVRVWDARTGELLGRPFAYQGRLAHAHFDSSGARIFVMSHGGGTDRTASGAMAVWDAPAFSAADAALLAELAEACGGFTVDERGAVVAIPVRERRDRLTRLRHLTAGAPEGQPTALSFARWLFADPWTRTISPLSRVTVPQYICEAIQRGDVEEAQRAFPGHPLLRGSPTGESLPSECAGARH